MGKETPEEMEKLLKGIQDFSKDKEIKYMDLIIASDNYLDTKNGNEYSRACCIPVTNSIQVFPYRAAMDYAPKFPYTSENTYNFRSEFLHCNFWSFHGVHNNTRHGL